MKKNRVIRKPIMLGKNAVAVIHIFDKTDHFEDMWMFDSDVYDEELRDVTKESAKEIVNQFEDWWSVNFLKAMRNEIDDRIKKHQEEYNMKD